MNAQEFEDGMARLRSRKLWETGLDASFAETLWAKIKHYPWDTFKIVIEETLGQHNKPTVEVLMNACSYVTRATGNFIGPKIVEDDCQWCDGAGIVMMTSPDKLRTAPFHCTHCKNGSTQKHLTSGMSDGSIASARQGWGIHWRPANKALLARCEQASAVRRTQRLPYRDEAHY